MIDCLDYIERIGRKAGVMSKEREFELLALAKSPDASVRADAEDQLLRAHFLFLIRSVLMYQRIFRRRREDVEDEFNEACIAFLQAIRKHDFSWDARLVTFGLLHARSSWDQRQRGKAAHTPFIGTQPRLTGLDIGRHDIALRLVDERDEARWLLSKLSPESMAIVCEAVGFERGKLTRREIAQAHGITHKGVIMRIHKAHVKMRKAAEASRRREQSIKLRKTERPVAEKHDDYQELYMNHDAIPVLVIGLDSTLKIPVLNLYVGYDGMTDTQIADLLERVAARFRVGGYQRV